MSVPVAASGVRRSRRWRLRVALISSALLHLAAGVMLKRLTGHRATPWSDVAPAIEITLAEAPSTPAPTDAPTKPAETPAQRSRPTDLTVKKRAAPHPAAALGEAPPPAPPAAPSPDRSDQPAPAPIDLSFDALVGETKARVAGSAPAPTFLETRPGTRPKRSVDELRAESEARADGEAFVSDGRADPVLFDLLRVARARLEPAGHRIAEALPLGPSASMAAWGRGYLKRVEQVHGDRDAATRTGGDDRAADPHPDVLATYAEAARQAEAGAEQRTAEVCLIVAPGQPPVPRLRRSSQNAELDQVAIDAFQAAATDRPWQTSMAPGFACYWVRIAAFRVPPTPSLSFGIKNGKPSLIYPLKRITKVTVELHSMERPSASSSAPRFLRKR